MKVAIILTGHLRCWETVFPNFKQKFIDRYNPDIFIHSWDEEGWWQPSDVKNVKGYYDQTPKIDKQKVIDFYKPKESFYSKLLKIFGSEEKIDIIKIKILRKNFPK